MEMSEKKKTPLSDLMDASLAKIREMVDSNTVVGQPITTPDGVTLIPVSRLSFGFGAKLKEEISGLRRAATCHNFLGEFRIEQRFGE